MTNIPFGHSFVETDDGFAIHQKDAYGNVTTIPFSGAELWGLMDTISRWRDRVMSQHQVEGGSVVPIIAHAVAQVRLMLDAVKENVLMTTAAPSGEQQTLQFGRDVAAHIAAELPSLIEELRRGRTRQ